MATERNELSEDQKEGTIKEAHQNGGRSRRGSHVL